MLPIWVVLLLQPGEEPAQAYGEQAHPIHIHGVLGHAEKDKDGDRRDDGDVPVNEGDDVDGARGQQHDCVPGAAVAGAVAQGGEVVSREGAEVDDAVDAEEYGDGEVGNDDGGGHAVEAAAGTAGAVAGDAVGGCEDGGCCCCDLLVAEVDDN